MKTTAKKKTTQKPVIAATPPHDLLGHDRAKSSDPRLAGWVKPTAPGTLRFLPRR
jgi:hypothetical protein